jgi:hypothetical protein
MNQLVAIMFPKATNLHAYDATTNLTTIFDKGKPTCSFPGLAPTHDGVTDMGNLEFTVPQLDADHIEAAVGFKIDVFASGILAHA